MSLNSPLKQAAIIAGRIPSGAQIVGVYEDLAGRKSAMVRLKNGRLVSFCSGAMRMVDERRITNKGARYFSTQTVVERHVPPRIDHVTHGIDPDLVR
jgi:hypothetical protein